MNVERRHLPWSAEDAAALVLDWSRDAEWRAAVVRMDVEPPGRARIGQRITEELHFGGRTFVTPTTITAADERSGSFAGGNANAVVEGRRTVVPDAGGGCTVVLEVGVRMTGLLAVLNPVLAGGYRRRLAAEADALVALAVARSAVQPTSSTARSADPTSRA
ncbi:Polyketide cyclase / dehydrase and lipid transport [Blastococcus aurantiacus]|uniref:Polyketide cyclase / dehydrase and lipid transport n=1 Tax=Blastococcus aurantiacus TaxID=1550231 RepID=A0A1G7QAD1_9ACTN|nr:SRPBCC family protein [Blastococcus aurantiacus]SDF95511.1 Polyketide cyclase / dehydrase and lipid transport [Blastococcus aurantiacus]